MTYQEIQRLIAKNKPLLTENLLTTEELKKLQKKLEAFLDNTLAPDSLLGRRCNRLKQQPVALWSSEGIPTNAESFIEPWVSMFEAYVDSIAVKQDIDVGDKWIQTRVRKGDEDLHVLAGTAASGANKAHMIIDGKSGEQRFEDGRTPMESLFPRIQTDLFNEDGSVVRVTREVMQPLPSESVSQSQSHLLPPVIEVTADTHVSNIGTQSGVLITVSNQSDRLFRIVECTLDDIPTSHSSSRLEERDVFSFGAFKESSLVDGYRPQFKLVVRDQLDNRYLYTSSLLIQQFGTRLDLLIPGEDFIEVLSRA